MKLTLAMLVFLVLQASVVFCASPRSSFPVFHSLDGGQTWSQKGKVSFRMGLALEAQFNPGYERWTEEMIDSLLELNKAGGFYYIRLPHYIDPDANDESVHDKPPEDHVTIAVAPCAIFNSNFQEDYAIYFSSVAIGSVAINGVQNNGIKLKSSARNYCSEYTISASSVLGLEDETGSTSQQQASNGARTRGSAAARAGVPPTKITSKSFGETVKHRAQFTSAVIAKPPAIQDPEAPRQQQQQRGKDGNAPPAQEKSFIQKYWIWIVLGLVLFSLQAPQPPQPGQPGAGQPGGGSAAASPTMPAGKKTK